MENTEKEHTLSEIISTQALNDYEAVDALWKALTKVVGLMSGVDEIDLQSLDMLSDRFTEEEMNRLLKDGSVDSLIFLDPPLETLLTDPEGESDDDSSMRIIAKLRSSRDSDFREAFVNLGTLLKRICHELPRSFKGELGDGIQEVLLSARKILYLLSIVAVSKLT
jgi:hypothetical protein